MAHIIVKAHIPDAQIEQLRTEAIAAHDYDMAAICDLALDGEIDTDDYTVLSGHWASKLRHMSRDEAYAECARAINEASAAEESGT